MLLALLAGRAWSRAAEAPARDEADVFLHADGTLELLWAGAHRISLQERGLGRGQRARQRRAVRDKLLERPSRRDGHSALSMRIPRGLSWGAVRTCVTSLASARDLGSVRIAQVGSDTWTTVEAPAFVESDSGAGLHWVIRGKVERRVRETLHLRLVPGEHDAELWIERHPGMGVGSASSTTRLRLTKGIATPESIRASLDPYRIELLKAQAQVGNRWASAEVWGSVIRADAFLAFVRFVDEVLNVPVLLSGQCP